MTAAANDEPDAGSSGGFSETRDAGAAGGSDPADTMVDWNLAVATARRLSTPGPQISRRDAAKVVKELRSAARIAEGHVAEYTGLTADSATAPVLIVDRGGWVQANADALAAVLRPLIKKMRDTRGDPGWLATAIGSRVAGLEAGGLFAFLSSRVLGQFDPFHDSPVGHVGRLLLVAPNVVHVERQLNVDPRDFRLWVCLHEETHRVQFTAVPWLRAHLLDELGRLVESAEFDAQKIAAMSREALEQVGRLLRGDRNVSLLDIVQTPEQRAVIERMTAVMSLLEGHADVVMDGVGPSVIPTVDAIRRKFTVRRQGAGSLDQLLRRLLGFDAKMRQYRDGAVFVKGAMERVGMEGFNAVWAERANLPTKDELADPAAWVARVHG